MIILITPEELHVYMGQRLITENGKYDKCIVMFDGKTSIYVYKY